MLYCGGSYIFVKQRFYQGSFLLKNVLARNVFARGRFIKDYFIKDRDRIWNSNCILTISLPATSRRQ